MTHYVYILISHENNNYAAMCLISALSVRGVDAHAKITVLSDAQTLAMLKHCHHQLLEVADEVQDCELEEPPMIASRILKTTLLQRLQSDFIFLDVDTIVMRPIAPRLQEAPGVQMALDREIGTAKTGFPWWVIPHYERVGWEHPTRQYFNSGVIFVRADDVSRRLFEEWHTRWRAFVATGCHLDQLPLNSAIETLGTEVTCLPIAYNAMVRVDEAYRWGARVLHFYASGKNLDAGTEYARLAALVTAGQRLTLRDVRKAAQRRWPLVEPWKLRRHLKAGSLYGAWLCYRKRLMPEQQKTPT